MEFYAEHTLCVGAYLTVYPWGRGGGGGGEESAKFFPSQRHEIFILQCVRVSEDYPTISEDFSKLSRMFQKMLKF